MMLAFAASNIGSFWIGIYADCFRILSGYRSLASPEADSRCAHSTPHSYDHAGQVMILQNNLRRQEDPTNDDTLPVSFE